MVLQRYNLALGGHNLWQKIQQILGDLQILPKRNGVYNENVEIRPTNS
jgi:hypothetical protein